MHLIGSEMCMANNQPFHSIVPKMNNLLFKIDEKPKRNIRKKR